MNKNREFNPYGSVVNMQVKATLLVVKLQVYGKVIFVLKLLYHSIIKIHQKTFLCPLEDILDHVSRNIIFFGDLYLEVMDC